MRAAVVRISISVFSFPFRVSMPASLSMKKVVTSRTSLEIFEVVPRLLMAPKASSKRRVSALLVISR